MTATIAAVFALAIASATADADAGGQRDATAAGVDCGSADDCLQKATARDNPQAAAKDGYERAALLYERACDQGNAQACTRIGELLSSGLFFVGDDKRRLALFEKACSQGYAPACYPAGHAHFRGSRTPGAFPRDYAKAAAFFDKGCSLGEGGCCHSLAELTRDGKGVKKDKRRAAALFKRAKTLGFEIPDCR